MNSNALFGLIMRGSFARIFTASLIVLILTVTGTLLFRSFLSEELEGHVCRQIYEFADTQELYFHDRMTALHDYIDAFSLRIERMRHQKSPNRDIRNEIQYSVLYVRFLYSGIIFRSGECWYSDGKMFREIHSDRLRGICRNESGEIESLVYEESEEKFLTIYKAFRWSETETAFVFASVPFSNLSDFLFARSGKEAAVMLVDSDSLEILLSTGENKDRQSASLAGYMADNGMREFSEKVAAAIENGHSCLINESDETALILFQRPLNFGNWVMVVAMDSGFDVRLHENVMRWFLIFSIGNIVLVIGLLLYIIFSTRTNAGILSKARSQMLSQQRNFEVIADNYNGGIVMTLADGSGKVLYCNQGALDLFGYTMDEFRFVLHGESGKLFADEGLKKIQDLLNRHSDSRDKIQCDVRMIKKDGTVFWCRVQGSILKDESGIRRGIWAVYDIDERKQAEEKLMQSEFFYRVSSALTSDWVFCYRFKTGTIDMPNEAMRQNGFPSRLVPDDLIRRGYIHSESVAEFREIIRQVEQGEKIVSGTLKLCLPQGRDRWFDVRISVWNRSDREPETAIVVMRDITKEKDSEIRYVDELNFRNASLSGVLASYEFNLSKDSVIGGPELMTPPKSASFSRFAAWYSSHMVYEEDRNAVNAFFRAEHLKELYSCGICSRCIEYRELQDNDTWRWVAASVTLFCSSGDNDLHVRIYLNDIHRQKEEELALRRRAEYDSLLNIPNRHFYEDIVSAEIRCADAEPETAVFAVLDVDNFKQINDTYGHQSGDLILQQLAAELKRFFGEERSVTGRLGGDEFSVYLSNRESFDKAVDELKHFVTYLNRISMTIDSARTFSVSVGCTAVRRGDTFEALYHRADEALYRAKSQGKNRVIAG